MSLLQIYKYTSKTSYHRLMQNSSKNLFFFFHFCLKKDAAAWRMQLIKMRRWNILLEQNVDANRKPHIEDGRHPVIKYV